MKIATAIVALLAATPAAAQEWTFRGTVYGWLPALDTSVDTARGTVSGELSMSDVLDALDMAFMGVLEARYGRWGVIGDLTYANLSSSASINPASGFEGADIGTRLTIFSGYGVYRVAETPQISLDLGAGFRAFSMALDVDLDSGARGQDLDLGIDGQWTVPILAARIVAPFSERWFGTAVVDAGAWLDDSTWQALATLGYNFNARWSMQAGYRYMNIETQVSGRDVSLDMSGPIIGVSARF